MANEDIQTAKSLGDFVDKVTELRDYWGLPKHKELWFRGEAKDYESTSLRPELYRPANDEHSLKRIWQLLDIESELHAEFKRNAVEFEKGTDDDWDWDSYFLMQHHEGPTRLLDWSDGALMALHFALREKRYDDYDARVYVLEPYRLTDKIKETPEIKVAAEKWAKFANEHPSAGLDEDSWEDLYLPSTDRNDEDLNVPLPPLVLEFAHITRRIAAQRSRFIVFGTEPGWLLNEFKKENAPLKLIVIPKASRPKIRQQLRDCGITESVIYPDLDGLGREMKQLWEDRRSAPEENA